MMSPRCSRFLSRDPLGKLLLLNTGRRSPPRLDPHPPSRHPLPPSRNASTQSLPLPPRPSSHLPFSKNATSAYYATAVLIGFLGLTYAAVPIYRIVCQKTGWGGTPMTDSSKFSPEHMIPVATASGRRIKVTFSASTSDSLPWSFRPLQREISLLPGETALAFYKARNKGKEDIIGIATYNVFILRDLVAWMGINGRSIRLKWLLTSTKFNVSALKNKNLPQARK